MEDYDLFISSDETLAEGEEIKLTIRDTRTLEHIEVKAVVYRSEELPDTDRLWVRIDDFGDVRRGKKPWSIRIVERIEKPMEEVTIRRPEGPLSKRKGHMLRSMLEEAGRKKITKKILEEEEGKKKH